MSTSVEIPRSRPFTRRVCTRRSRKGFASKLAPTSPYAPQPWTSRSRAWGAWWLSATDVLTWWGHAAHDDVADDVVERVCDRVRGGMGLVVLHSGHYSRVFRELMGTTCALRWRNAGERELVWTVAPGQPIADGLPDVFAIPRQETYGEFFDVPPPDELGVISSFAGGEVFRSGCCFARGRGRIFYFSPGDQEYPVYHQAEVRRVIANAVRWAAPRGRVRDAPFEPIHADPP